MLMITDVVEGSSRLLMVDQPLVLDELPYRILRDGTFLAEGVVSRKNNFCRRYCRFWRSRLADQL